MTFRILIVCLSLALGAGAARAAGFDLARRNAAVALIEQGMPDAARDVLRALIAKDPRFAFDRINLAFALLKAHGRVEEALDALDAAAKIDASYVSLHFLRGLALMKLHRYPAALAAFEDALARQPGCAQALYQKGRMHDFLGQAEDAFKAFEAFARAADGAYRNDPATRRAARFLGYKHLSLQATALGRDEESERYHGLAMQSIGDDPNTPLEDALDFAPCLRTLDPSGPEVRAELARESVPAAAPCTAPALELAVESWPGAPATTPASVAALGWTTSGLALLRLDERTFAREGAPWTWRPGPDLGPGTVLAVADLDDDRRDDVVMRRTGGAVEVLGAVPVPLAELRSTGPVLAVDQDHDGDLDLVAVGEVRGKPGLWTYQNRTPATTPSAPVLSLVSGEQVGLTTATTSPIAGLAAGDVDEGNDLDVVAFPRGGAPFVLMSRRAGRFDRVVLDGPACSGPGALADLSGDGHLDLAYPTEDGAVVRIGRGDGAFGSPARHLAGRALVELQAADLDGDMREDLLVRDREGALALLMGHGEGFRPLALPQAPRASSTPLIDDLDGDGALDLCIPGGPFLRNRSAARAGHVRITPGGLGGVTHGRGVGSRVWVRVGPRVIRREVRHAGEIFALGGCERADLVRLQWTNGIRQSHLDKESGDFDPSVPSGSQLAPVQLPGPKASCPYLYVDRGNGPEYVTDLLAAAPLGLPSPAGGLVPTAPQELVLIPRAAWAAVGGRYRLRITEEFREITYLDRARLWVVDHAPALTVLPDAGMGTPPGDARVLAFDRADAPRSAIGPGGEDLTLLVAQSDGHHFEPPRGRLQGVAPEHAIELTFPPLEPGRRACLLIDGLIYFSDAGINTRLAQSEPGAMAPPRLEVPAPGGGWRAALDFVRFPAGRSKTALTDVTRVLDPRDPRLRLVSRMRIYLDRIALVSARGDLTASLAVRRLDPARAEVVFHGIAPLGPDPDRPPWFIVSSARRRSSLEASFLVPAGDYTGRGPVGPLLAAFDDRYAIIGPGDGIDLEFVAPAPRAAARDLFLELAGYDKDAHPATYASDRVEPLPYRGMPAYGPGARFDVGTQRRLRQAHARWSTRPRSGWGGTAPAFTTR